MIKVPLVFLFVGCWRTLAASEQAYCFADAPGVVIDYVPPCRGYYIGSPSIARGPSGVLFASHDYFTNETYERSNESEINRQTAVFKSTDGGASWAAVSIVDGQFWSKLFFVGDELYLLGTNRRFGAIVIRRSRNEGRSWTYPIDKEHGLLTDEAGYHTAPVTLVEYDGRLWRSFEHSPYVGDAPSLEAFLLSVPLRANLLDRRKWRFTDRHVLGSDDLPESYKQPKILEGNVITLPSGGVGCLYRFENRAQKSLPYKAVMMTLEKNTLVIDKKSGLTEFNDGSTKFWVAYDSVSRSYWAISNYSENRSHSDRRCLALSSSPDALSWTMRARLLEETGDQTKVGFQYPDAVIVGQDLLVVSRTAINGAHSYHDANYLTFHKITDFRNLSLKNYTTVIWPAHRPRIEPPALPAKITTADFLDIPIFVSGDAEDIVISGLPPGLRFNSGTMTVSGRVEVLGTYIISIAAKNRFGPATPVLATFSVNDAHANGSATIDPEQIK